MDNSLRVAAYIPSYCLKLNANPPELTWMNRKACEIGVNIVKNDLADYAIISTAYSTWQVEAELKRKVFLRAGIPLEKLFVIGPVEDSYDEADQAEEHMARNKSEKMIVVADSYHEPRAVQTFELMFPKMKVRGVPFKTERFDTAYEPHSIKLLGAIKSFRSGHKFPWRARNYGLLKVNPFLVNMHLNKLKREGKLRPSPYR